MTTKLFTKNFTLLVFGQTSSLFGNIILRFALSMYVLDVTGSATIFAGILAAATVPTILLSPLGGILADRANRKNIMVVLDSLTGLFVLCAALLLRQGHGIAVTGGLMVVLSVLGAFETPTVQACVPQMQTGDNIIRGNAVVNQVASLAALLAPLLGSLLYTAFGLLPVMLTTIVCFFVTAALECFIKLEYTPFDNRSGVFAIIKNDFSASVSFMYREQPGILKLLLLVAASRFFVMGAAMVGLPYIVRTVLGLSAAHYGVAESMLAVATIVGSIAAGLLTGRLKTKSLSLVLGALGAFLLPAGLVFLLPSGTMARYIVNVAAFCGVQLAACVFSIFTVSIIQQKTPNHMLGKVMSYIVAITTCVQPIGQLVYGMLFDSFSGALYLVLLPTGVIVCAIGLASTGFFKKLA